MNVIQTNNYEALSQRVADYVQELVGAKDQPVLGLATGSTPVGFYEYIRQTQPDWSHVTTFNLDEYVGISPSHSQSYRTFMEKNLFSNISVMASYIPDGQAHDLTAECTRYEQLIAEQGQIDLQILGLGHNGHIGFNEPGTSFQSRTHIVDLAETTRQANARFFESIDDVPTQAITMGIQTIMEAKKIVLMVSGHDKQHAFNRLMEGEVDEQFPASVLHHHPDVTVFVSDVG
ncbi:glucosamine-6-phosphate deaminase [Aquisalibacillus elongatus]|uniref:Glucosamine-6-phosphate deaminase n=1 Tax=Aquisalibacillus elongatus TaxID=485577 RepID=A0A3N5BUM9_9BACI|nr:glucosamine-6-phosphate deaminase [Aquisalibacillus elongatus]RPF51092.1 glucosamine-6-phosphate deaminase [Aquisalibacillus elongatus]